MKPPILSDEEKLGCSLISKYPYKEVKDVIIEACLHQLDADVAYYEPLIQQAKQEARFTLLEWFRNYAHQLDRKFPHPTTEEQGWLGNIWDMIKMAGKEDAEIDFILQANEVAREMIKDIESWKYLPEGTTWQSSVNNFLDNLVVALKSKYGGQK